MPTNRFRLDKSIQPKHYAIEITPNLDEFTFLGTETIEIKAKQSFSKITLHALDLRVSKIRLTNSSTSLTAKRTVKNKELETITFDFGKRLPAGKWFLSLNFQGFLNDKMHGFYRTAYQVKGQDCWGAATQFEATDARRCFPCWDEPDSKATFGVTLCVPNKLTALSNMPVESESKIKGTDLKKLTFEPTPIMSTYLLAFVVADLEYVEAKDKNGTLVRIYATRGKKNQCRFALDVALHTLPYFGKWFGIKYALPKCDMVALPDFASGAMENWGLITYRETALLVDSKNSSVAAKQRVAEVIDHELAHQWFGNLVTMEWWTDLWLNEGFASYMGPKAVANQFPEWKVWNQFVAGEYLTALKSDSYKNTHPIEIAVKNPHEIREIFDHITYNKGSSVNRMLEHYLSEKVFRKGLGIYLKRYAYKNARTQDLWKTLEEVSGKPIRKIMASFTQQGGYPVVHAEKPTASTLKLQQSRFFFNGATDPKKQKWIVPIVLKNQKSAKTKDLALSTFGMTTPHRSAGWLKINPDQSGFYRTAYSAELLKPLTQAVAKKQLSDLDSLGILDDTFALAKAGYMETSQALDLVSQLTPKHDYTLWATAAGIIGSIRNILDVEQKKALNGFVQELWGPVLKQLTWKSKRTDSHLEQMLRPLAISVLGVSQDPDVIQKAQSLFKDFLKGKSLDPNLRGAIYGIVAENANNKTYDALVNLYKKSSLQEERVRILRSLARVQNKALINRTLKFALSKDVRAQDAFIAIACLGGNSQARHITWEFTKKNWKDLTKRYSQGGLGLMNYIVEGTTGYFNDPADLKDVQAFFKKHPVRGAERAMKLSLENIRAAIKWKKRDHTLIVCWLNQHE